MLKKTILVVAGTFFLVGTISCGTMIYPERRGQKGGRIDPAVAMMDGIGLLVFILPGLIAYAVDFGTGAIYLPGTRKSEAETGVKVVRSASREWDDIAAALEEHTGGRPDLADPALRVYQPDRRDLDLGAELAALAAGQPVAAGWTSCSLSPSGILTTGEERQSAARR